MLLDFSATAVKLDLENHTSLQFFLKYVAALVLIKISWILTTDIVASVDVKLSSELCMSNLLYLYIAALQHLICSHQSTIVNG